ncbi:hypothetical protein SETIT_3G042800v2 [Setaria italica]|uniref:Uncharacterized protein n=1 Tax=Setaria italica TaxID=4555 RepID=A0A368QBJ3_SETIT|nr:hypothetical protein SETIT_3G042800v2 [Setaria italica]
MDEAAAAALGGGCQKGKKRAHVVESLVTENHSEKRVKANCWEPSEDAYVESVRESGRARSLRSQATMAMVAKVLAQVDEFLYSLKKNNINLYSKL